MTASANNTRHAEAKQRAAAEIAALQSSGKASERDDVVAAISGHVASGDYDVARELLAQVGGPLLADHRKARPPETVADQPIERVVFICGLHRSGTSLLYDQLASKFDVRYFHDLQVPQNEGQFAQDVYSLDRPFGGPGSFALYPQMRFGPVEDADLAAQYRQRLLEEWSTCTLGESPVLLEKSPPNLTKIPYLRSIFPGAKFIVWMRDPRAVSLSTRKWHKLPLKALMLHWNAAYMQALEDIGDDCTVLRYEQLCADPEGTINEISRFCGLSPRAEPIHLKQKFSEILNTNPAYLAKFPKQFRLRHKILAWELFGYKF